MAKLESVEWEPCLLEPVHNPEAERKVRRALGPAAQAARYFLDNDWMVRMMIALHARTLPLAYTSLELSQMLALVVSQDNTCRYCYAATRGVMTILGFPEAQIRRLEEDLLTAELPAGERAALDFARRVSRASPPPGVAEAEPLLRAGYDTDAVKEIAFVAALNVCRNRIATLPALPVEEMESIGDRWYIRLSRPLIARILRAQFKREAPRPLRPDQRGGPFSQLVCALEPLPVALRLREVIDDLFASTILGRRPKLLVLAVVAHGLGSQPVREEAVRLLAADGVGREEAERVLANLGSPALDPLENAIVAFARQTIWYEPGHIQRRMRELADRLQRPQLVELVGVVALANAFGRLGVVMELPSSLPSFAEAAAG